MGVCRLDVIEGGVESMMEKEQCRLSKQKTVIVRPFSFICPGSTHVDAIGSQVEV
jgi:hypothetical protein